MEYRFLGETGIQVSRFCLGTMMLGALGNRDSDACVKIIRRALAAGINFIDTADVYSAGESEELIGKAIAGQRNEVVIATKFGYPAGAGLNASGGSRRWILRAVEASLRRLKTDYIDLYLMHRFDGVTAIEETQAALSDLVHQGKIRAFGFSMLSADRIVESHWLAERCGLLRPRCEQPGYSLFAREAESCVLPACHRYGMGVMVFSPLDDGWLTGRYRTAADFAKGGRVVRMASRSAPGGLDNEVMQRKLALVRTLSEVAAEAGVSLMHMALAFTLEHPAVTAAIIGPRTLEHLEDLLAGAELRLTGELLDRIDALVPPGTNVNPVQFTTGRRGLRHADRRSTPEAI